MTLRLHDVPLVDALHAIEAQANLRLNYTDRVIPASKRVTITVERVPARKALAGVLEGTGVVLQESAGGDLMLVKDAARQRSVVEPDTAGHAAEKLSA